VTERDIAKSYEEKLRAYRRHLHQNPELSFQEEKTAAWVRQNLSRLGIPVMEGVRGNSTVGIVTGTEPGPVLLFRADMDALPVSEQTGAEYASKTPGVMHACGHDAHTATLMCFAEYLAAHRDQVRGTVKLVFQQAEEKAPGGGSMIVEDGVLEDVDAVFAWHCAPEPEVGRIVAAGGPRTASFDDYRIRIKGKGGHSGFPFRSVDPITTGAMVVGAISQLPAWEVDPMDSVAMIVSHFSAGQPGVHNIIPEEAVIEGMIRSLNNDTAKQVLSRVEELAQGICQAKRCSCEMIKTPGYPALWNDPALAGQVREALRFRGLDAVEADPVMAAEDFAFYTGKCPGVYLNIGTRNPKREDTWYPPHNPHFDMDEQAMVIALEALLVIYNDLTKTSK